MLALHIAFDRVEQPVRAKVWRDEVAAYDMGDIAAQWFSDFLSEPGRPQTLRLVRFDPEHKRLSSPQWTGGVEAQNQFSDGFALLVTSEASLTELNDKLVAAGHAAVGVERFRPNIVLAGVEAQDVVLAVRRAVGDEVGLTVREVRLVGPGELPVTTSGKVQRARARLEFLAARPTSGAVRS
jgi:acyl-CoA synthetase (AMP-forming)/AMP-acid ligase II